MPLRKKQAKPHDDLAISRSIAKVSDPALQEFLEATVDVVTAISGNQQVENIAQREQLARDMAAERHEVYAALKDVRLQVAEGNRARAANAEQVADFLKLVLKEQEAVKQGQSLLAGEFSSGVEHLNERLDTIDARLEMYGKRLVALEEWRILVDREMASFRQSRDRSMQRHEETKAHRDQQDKQLGELLDLVYKLGVDLAALKERGE